MKSRARRALLRPSVAVGLLATMHLIALYALDSVGIMDRLLAPAGLDSLVWVAVGAAFLVLRVALILFGPGLLLADLGWLAGQFMVRRLRA